MSYFNTLFFEDYWNIGIIKDSFPNLLQDKKPEIKWYPNTKREEFLADPFIIVDSEDSSILHIFCEIFSFKTHRGRIGHLTYNTESEEFTEVMTVLEEPYHLAYPFIVKSNGEIFMIPETAENSQVSLYKAQRFPYEWKKVNILIDQYQGVDNSILYKDQTWWLFSTDMEKGQHSHLNIHFSDNLNGDWISHPQNPVKTGEDKHRCAGTPFFYEGDLIRPSMNCVHTYGGNIILNRIKTLTKKMFEEETIGEITADKESFFKDKTHTLSKAGNFAIIDGCRETLFCVNPYMIRYKVKFLSKKLNQRMSR